MKKFYRMFICDFKMTLREKEALFWMFAFPILMMLILGFVFGNSGSLVLDVGVVDQDGSFISKQVVKAFEAVAEPTEEAGEKKDAPLKVTTGGEKEELDELEDGKRNGVLVIQKGFADSIISGKAGEVTIYVDESEVTTAEITKQTIIGILDGISREIARKATGAQEIPEMIKVEEKQVTGDDFDYIDFMIPGILAMTIMFAGLMGYAQEIASYREKGILRRIKVSPISLPTFLASGMTTVLILVLVQTVLLLLVGVLAFGVNIGGNYFYIAILVLIGGLSFLALGFMISSLAGTAKSATLAATAVAMPMMFLAGIFFSVDMIPRWLAVIAQCLPLYYFADALREVMIHGASLAAVWFDILVMVVFGLICFLVSVKFFRWE